MMKLVTPKLDDRKDFELTLDEIAREGARRMLVQTLNLEVEEYIPKPSKLNVERQLQR